MELTQFLMESLEEERAWGNLMIEGAAREHEILMCEDTDVQEKAADLKENSEGLLQKAKEQVKKMYQSFMNFIKGAWQTFTEKVNALIEKVKSMASSAATKAKSALQAAKSKTSEMATKVKEATKSFRDAVAAKSKDAIAYAKQKLSDIKAKAMEIFQAAKQKVVEAKEYLKNKHEERKIKKAVKKAAKELEF